MVVKICDVLPDYFKSAQVAFQCKNDMIKAQQRGLLCSVSSSKLNVNWKAVFHYIDIFGPRFTALTSRFVLQVATSTDNNNARAAFSFFILKQGAVKLFLQLFLESTDWLAYYDIHNSCVMKFIIFQIVLTIQCKIPMSTVD